MSNLTVRDIANNADPNSILDVLRAVRIGDVLTQHLPRVMRARAPTASDVTLAAPLVCDRIRLDGYCKASRIRRAWARTSGGGTLGEMTIHALGANPGANEIAVAPNGDIVTRHADLYTSVDVDYEPAVGTLITLTGVPVVPGTGVAMLPAAIYARAPHLLVSAQATSPAVADKVVTWRAAAAPAAGFACLNLVGDRVFFAVADAVTLCTLSLLVKNDVDPQAVLLADATSP